MGKLDPAAAPSGKGGRITPGTYALTSITARGGQDTDPLVGAGITQTLYFSASSALFESDDDHRFSFTGAYSYSVKGAALKLAPTCESQPGAYRQWSLDLTFTAAPTKLSLF